MTKENILNSLFSLMLHSGCPVPSQSQERRQSDRWRWGVRRFQKLGVPQHMYQSEWVKHGLLAGALIIIRRHTNRNPDVIVRY